MVRTIENIDFDMNGGVAVNVTQNSIYSLYFLLSALADRKVGKVLCRNPAGQEFLLSVAKDDSCEYRQTGNVLDIELSQTEVESAAELLSELILGEKFDANHYDISVYNKDDWKKAVYWTVRLDRRYYEENIISKEDFLKKFSP